MGFFTVIEQRERATSNIVGYTYGQKKGQRSIDAT
jgi:hypothetical protein